MTIARVPTEAQAVNQPSPGIACRRESGRGEMRGWVREWEREVACHT